MPVTIIKNAMKYRNPTTGEYEGFNAIQNNDTASQIAQIEDAGQTAVENLNDLYEEYEGQIGTSVADWIEEHPEAITTVQDGSITKAKLNSELQGVVDTVQALNGGRYNQMNYRWHVDCVNGNDNDTGAAGHAWKTLDKFFSMANKLDGGRADIRCYLDTPGTYDVQCEADSNIVFTGVALHITGGLDSDAAYDGQYIVRFLTTGEVKWYASHVNLRNVRIECPNSTVDEPFIFDGGNYSVANCYINTVLVTYHSGVTIATSTIKNIVISGGAVYMSNAKTLLTSGNQITLVRGARVTYCGSISEGSLIANSSYSAFSVTASILFITQVFPTALGPSVTASNSVLICTSGRKTSWESKAGTMSNVVWVTG